MICKIKLSGANVVQNFNYVKNIHRFLELLSFQVTYVLLSKLQTSYISTLHIYFGMCWHQ
jgi:hypothetical protein